ncbi:7739_t:CDS:2, partial [Rhizophagus irregularis]
MAHNSSNNFGDNVYESNSQKTVAQTYDTYLPVMPVTYCDNVNNPISDQISNTISPNQQPNQPNAASPNHNQQYDNAISNYSDNVTNSPDQQPNVSSPNHNQQYHQHHSVASPNHQQQYDASYQQYIHQTAISNNTDSIIPGHNHHQQPSDNNNHDNHNNNQQSSSDNNYSPQSDIPPLSLNITINSPQTNFIIIPNSDMIQQVLACLNNPSSGFQR